MIAHVLGFDGAVGAAPGETSTAATPAGFDGPFAYREGKAERDPRARRARGLDLAQSYAYSDSESDLPMLRAVGHPVAVNPDARAGARRAARRAGTSCASSASAAA